MSKEIMDNVMFLKWQHTIGWGVHRQWKGKASSPHVTKGGSEIEAEL